MATYECSECGMAVNATCAHCDAPLVDDILAILGEKHNLIRYHLGQKLTLKYTPRLRFYYDNTMEQAERINHLLEKINIDD